MRLGRVGMMMVLCCARLGMNFKRLVSMVSLRSASFVFVCGSRFQRVLRTMATEVANMASLVEEEDLGVHIVDVEQKLMRTYTDINSALPVTSAKGMLDALSDAAESDIGFFLTSFLWRWFISFSKN